MYRVTDEDVLEHTQAVLEWIRDPNYRERPTFQVQLGLLPHGGAISQAREDEFVDAILHATANLQEALAPVFSYACDRGCMRLLQVLLSMRGVEWTVSSLTKPLTLAAYSGHVEIVQYILAHAEMPPSDEVHLLMLKDAVEQGHFEMVEYLLQIADSNFDMNASAQFGDSPFEEQFTCGAVLERAIRADRVQVAAALLGHGASGLDDTPEIVRWVSSVAMAELLYAHGAYFSGDGGLDAALKSIQLGDRALLHVLLALGADIRRVQYRTRTPFQAAFTRTVEDFPVWSARRSDETECRMATIADLFAYMIDVDARDKDGLITLQSIATDGSYLENKDRLVQLLVDLGASTKVCEGYSSNP